MLATACAFYVVFIARASFTVGSSRVFTLFDDAMISMRYARNLATGAGLVWNSGEAPVEGYSNFLWTLWMVVPHLLRVSDAKASLLVALTGAAVLLAIAWVAALIVRELVPDSTIAPAIAAALAAFYYPLDYWTLRGMEVGALAFAVLSMAYAILRLRERWTLPRVVAAGCAALAALLLRADGVILVLALSVGAFAVLPKRSGRRLLVGLLLLVVATLAAHTLLRLAAYGDALPNTYYLKMTGVPLSDRILRGTAALWDVLTVHLWPAAVAAALLGRDLFRPPFLLFTCVVCGQAAYSVWAGGDAWEWMHYSNRYLATVSPPLLVLAACGLHAHARRTPAGRRAGGALVLIAAGLAMASPSAHSWVDMVGVLSFMHRYPALRLLAGGALIAAGVATLRSRRPSLAPSGGIGGRTSHLLWGSPRTVVWAVLLGVALNTVPLLQWMRDGGYHVRDDASQARLGITLREGTDRDARIAVVLAGSVPYFSHRSAVDLLGKSDRYVARLPGRDRFNPGHNKWDYAYSLRTFRPDVVVQLWIGTDADVVMLRSMGYERLPSGLWVLRSSTKVNRGGL